MEKQNENTNPNSIQDDEPFPELTQEQIDRIVNRQLMKLDREYQECIHADDINERLEAENSLKNGKENEDNYEKQEANNDDSENMEENGYENVEEYAQIDSDEEEETIEEDKEGSTIQQKDTPVFPEGSGFKKEIKQIPQEKAAEMQKFISNINIKPPSWAQNLSDEQFTNWVGKMLQTGK